MEKKRKCFAVLPLRLDRKKTPFVPRPSTARAAAIIPSLDPEIPRLPPLPLDVSGGDGLDWELSGLRKVQVTVAYVRAPGWWRGYGGVHMWETDGGVQVPRRQCAAVLDRNPERLWWESIRTVEERA